MNYKRPVSTVNLIQYAVQMQIVTLLSCQLRKTHVPEQWLVTYDLQILSTATSHTIYHVVTVVAVVVVAIIFILRNAC